MNCSPTRSLLLPGLHPNGAVDLAASFKLLFCPSTHPVGPAKCPWPRPPVNGGVPGQGIGVANGVDPNKSIIQTGDNEAQEVWIGVSYFYAATQYHDGQRFHDATLRASGLSTAYGVFAQTYYVAQNGYVFDTPEAWEIANVTQYRALQYMRPRSVWELVLAIKQPFPFAVFSKSKFADSL